MKRTFYTAADRACNQIEMIEKFCDLMRHDYDERNVETSLNNWELLEAVERAVISSNNIRKSLDITLGADAIKMCRMADALCSDVIKASQIFHMENEYWMNVKGTVAQDIVKQADDIDILTTERQPIVYKELKLALG